MAKKDALKERLKQDRAGGLTTLLGYDSAQAAEVPAVPEQPVHSPEADGETGLQLRAYTARPVGRPRKNKDDVHTSLAINRELFNNVKGRGAMMGMSLRQVLEEALGEWYAKQGK